MRVRRGSDGRKGAVLGSVSLLADTGAARAQNRNPEAEFERTDTQMRTVPVLSPQTERYRLTGESVPWPDHNFTTVRCSDVPTTHQLFNTNILIERNKVIDGTLASII